MSFLVPLAEMSFSKGSSAESVVCSPIEAADMAVVRWLNKPRCSNNVCIVIDYGGMLQNCDRFECTLFSHVEGADFKLRLCGLGSLHSRLSVILAF